MLNPSNNDRSGKVLTVLLFIIAILLVSLTSISLFFFQKEIDKRKTLESQLEASRVSEMRLDAELDDLKKEKELVDGRNKELDEKVNDLTGEVELEQGISKQLKSELASVKDQLAKETEKSQKYQDQLKRLADLEQENITFRSQFEEIKGAKDELEKKSQDLENKNQELLGKISDLEKTIQGYIERGVQAVQSAVSSVMPDAKTEAVSPSPESIGLAKIVISNRAPTKAAVKAATEGRVLTIDNETHFVIVSLGSRNGVSTGMELSVYHGDNYLGDLQVTQTQEEMSAADFITPLSSRTVRKDDRVVIK